jgi:hypothetical protein
VAGEKKKQNHQRKNKERVEGIITMQAASKSLLEPEEQ